MDQIDNYKIVKKIGEGGMGEVYKGVDVMLEREAAIKLLRPELKNRPDVIQRFKDEMIALGRLNHSNITTLYQYKFDPLQDKYYMALEFARGEPLEDILKREGSLPWQTAVQYAIEMLDGLDHAHSFNVVHRDIKPSNIIITEQNTVKIIDFGIARILETARLTQTGQFIGTLQYVSPEQIQGKDTDPRSDIYSVGAVIYEMLTGHIPFEKDTDYELRRSIVEEKPKLPLTFSSQIPVKLEQLILKALEKKPENRFSSAKEFSKELRKLVNASETPLPIPSHGGFIAFCKEYPGIVFLLFLLMIGGGYFLWQSGKTSEKFNNIKEVSPPTAQSDHSETSAIKSIVNHPIQPPVINPEKKEVENVLLPPPPIKELETLHEEVQSQPSEQKSVSKTKPINKLNSNKTKPEKRRPKPIANKDSSDSDPGIDDAAKSFFGN